jgi:Asp-tRNA(Asn)/Glu-tRNA(Gln) amidotransferase A subunit family amidase
MGMASSRILNDPPSVTPKDEVNFVLPQNVVRPATDEELMMMSVLEMQALLRQGDLTSVELTTIALSLLDKYDDAFNMNEVDTCDLALRVAGEADALFAAGDFRSFIQGIPFAVKDTYDVAGYATAYGSWEFM